MVKTLRITGIIAAILAVVLFSFPAVFGLSNDKDKDIEQFLNSPGVLEKFTRPQAAQAEGQNQDTPLVKQAEAFALYLNPPPPPQPQAPKASATPAQPPRPAAVSAKFELIGTSLYPLRPQLSLALIDEPGKGLRWVRQSGEIGHLVIEQIKDGLIVIRDGDKTEEIAAKRPPKRSLVKTSDGSKPNVVETIAAIAAGEADQISPEEAEWAQKVFAELAASAAAEIESDGNFSQYTAEERAAIEEILESVKSGRIGTQEANELDNLGKKLQAEGPENARLRRGIEGGGDPNQPADRKIERRRPRKPLGQPPSAPKPGRK
jgi:hypothetical protein